MLISVSLHQSNSCDSCGHWTMGRSWKKLGNPRWDERVGWRGRGVIYGGDPTTITSMQPHLKSIPYPSNSTSPCHLPQFNHNTPKTKRTSHFNSMTPDAGLPARGERGNFVHVRLWAILSSVFLSSAVVHEITQ